MRKVIFTFILFLGFFHSYSINFEYRFHHIGLDDGLPQSSILCIFHDSRGFIWFGTFDGLCRFDGNEIKVFLPKENDPYTINAGTIYKIKEGLDGKLYIATSGGGLNVYNPQTELFNYYKTDSTKNSVVGNIIYDILIANDHSVWIASYDGVSQFFPETGEFKTFSFGEKREHGYPEYTALSIYEEKNGTIWIGTYGGGICQYNKQNNEFYLYENNLDPADNYNNNVINQIEPYGNKTIILVTVGGTYKFNVSTKTYSKCFNANIIPTSVMVDTENNIWSTTEDDGVYILNDSGIMQHILHSANNQFSLPSNKLNLIYQDNYNNVWFGLSNKGIAFITTNQKKFYNLLKKDYPNSLVGEEVYGLAEDKYGNIWAGTLSGLSIINLKTGSYNNLTTDSKTNTIGDNNIWDILYDIDGYMWLATANGIDRFDFNTQKFKHFSNNPGDTNSLPNNEVFCLERDRNGNIWIGTYQGLARYSKTNNRWTSYFSSKQSEISNKIIWFVFSDSKDKLWLGTDMGLYKYNEPNDNFVVFGEITDSNKYLSQAEISYIHEDKEGKYWLATQMGLVRFNAETNQIKRFRTEDGLPSNVIYGILEKDNFIWFSSNKGLTKMNKFTFEIYNFDSNDGLQSNEFNIATLKLTDGSFLFGGINGITMFQPDNITDNTRQPELYFTGLSLNGQQIHPNDIRFGVVPLKKSITYATRINLSYNEKLIMIDFAALEYTHNKKILYKYRILPNSKKWIPLNHETTVTFTNLPPGKYQLEIQCTNSEQLWMNNTKTLSIVIYPPFYKQKWFYLIELITLVLLILWYIRQRIERVRKINIKLEHTVKERTEEIGAQKEELEQQRDRISEQKTKIERFAEELENKVLKRTEELLIAKENAEESDRLKSAFLANMSHEIRTPMNAIIGFSDLLLATEITEQEKHTYIELIKHNGESLLNLLNDILDISLIESGKIYIAVKEVSISKQLQKVYNQYKQNRMLVEKPRLSLQLDLSTVENTYLKIDPIRFNQILKNLVSNAIKYTSEGRVKISAKHINNNIIIKIEDTGIGIHPANHERIFHRFHKIDDSDTNPYRGNGLGLAITKSLVELMGGKIWMESEPMVGSTFYFSFTGTYEKSS